MVRNRVTKIITLLTFLILIIGLVAFKSGLFDKYLNGQVENLEKSRKISADSTVHEKIDTLNISPATFSSSKSIILLDQKSHSLIQDSLKYDSIRRSSKK